MGSQERPRVSAPNLLLLLATGPPAWPVTLLQVPATHSAARLDLGPLQGNGDTVQENEGQDHVVKELVGNDGLT